VASIYSAKPRQGFLQPKRSGRRGGYATAFLGELIAPVATNARWKKGCGPHACDTEAPGQA
jgi:hypothetical protein